ncbi:hypothetical protein GGI35DRAFT_70455 [Trichoderma velutinum]
MFFAACLLGLLTLPVVHADGWDDFSNNLATDLAPFLSLFGEQVTKQYLSESITTIDYFIFAMAPMGILTAIVSVIRVCGSPSLRAFIGRAQEGAGNAEAELCSSTSRDVCELYNNGGIARVFGRPKILEVVYDPEHNFANEKAGIYTFREFVKKHPEKWSGTIDGGESTVDVFAPNLSLNVGIKRKPPAVFWVVAMAGMALQLGVLGFAVVVTYYLRWEKDGSRPESYACPLVIAGTLLLCGGIFLCAFLVGQSTNERVFRRTQDDRCKQPTRESLYWVQPGGQVLGDQVFDAFCCSDHGKLQEYITSWKRQSKSPEHMVWAAVTISIIGFVMQFVGLRAVHSVVSVAQLGVIMLMSAARAALRMQRLKPDDNFLAQNPDEVVGHELDWLALNIGREDIQRELEPPLPDPSGLLHPSRRHLWRFCGNSLASTHSITPELPSYSDEPNIAAKLLAYRTRLAQLTQSQSIQTNSTISTEHFGVGMVEVRETAQRLALAMESAVNILFSKRYIIGEEWEHALSMFWGFACDVVSARPGHPSENRSSQHNIYLKLTRSGLDTPWRLQNKFELEGLMGLWVWSLKSDPLIEMLDLQSQFIISRAIEIPARRIVSTNTNIEIDFSIWLGDEIPSFTRYMLHPTSIQRSDPSTTWKQGKNQDKEQDSEIRFFGWHATELLQSDDSVPFSVWSASTDSSLVSLCAQEVFGSFFASILKIVDDMGEISIQETPHFRLESSLVFDMVKLFTETQLGSKKDALLCVLPSMIPQLRLASTESTLVAAMKNSNQHRKRGEWQQAETVLRWAWKICNESQPHPRRDDYQNDGSAPADELAKRATIALGELYRWAMRGNHDTKKFGSKGIEWLSTQKFNRREPGLLAVDEIIDRYNGIAEMVGQGNDIGGSGVFSEIKDDLNAILLYLTLSNTMTSEDKGIALCSAAKHGWAEVVFALLELGAEPDFKDPNQDSRTALSLAAESGNINTMRELINGGAFPNSVDAKNRSPLSYASEMGHSFAAKLLLGDQRVDPNSKDMEGRTPLFWASTNGCEKVMELLVKSDKIDLDMKDKKGRTVPIWAAVSGYEALLKLLVENNKVDLNAEGEDGWTPLLYAAHNGHMLVVKLLVESGKVDQNAKDNKEGRTPLFWAAMNEHEEVVNLLMKNDKVNLGTKDKEGKTLLSWVAITGCWRVMKLLVESDKVDLNAEYEDGWTPLLYAAYKGYTKTTKILVESGKVDLNAKTEYGWTPLLYAAHEGHEAVVMLLIQSGKVNINDKSEFGSTPLLYAAKHGHEAIVKLLVENGADINAEDDEGRTPLSWAIEGGYVRIAMVLRSRSRYDRLSLRLPLPMPYLEEPRNIWATEELS